jgi:hypothetical protein
MKSSSSRAAVGGTPCSSPDAGRRKRYVTLRPWSCVLTQLCAAPSSAACKAQFELSTSSSVAASSGARCEGINRR